MTRAQSHGTFGGIFFALMAGLPVCLGYGNLQFKDDNDNVVNSLWDERCPFGRHV